MSDFGDFVYCNLDYDDNYAKVWTITPDADLFLTSRYMVSFAGGPYIVPIQLLTMMLIKFNGKSR